jgi:hypothetical protein
MTDTEAHNHREIERLNQRGGRTLSIVDLIQAGTIDVAMAACGMRAMAEGASVLTGAVPGGAGKTTLMATMLHFLPPGVPIVTTDRSSVIADAVSRTADGDVCYLAHEIGSGHWYGYIWGRDVARFLALVDGPRRVASCLHADTLAQMRDILCSPPLGVAPEAFARVGLVMFMHVQAGLRGHRRRVATVYESDGGGGHRLLYVWEPAADRFRRVAEPRDVEGLRTYEAFVQRLVDEGDVEAEAVRRKVAAFYDARG